MKQRQKLNNKKNKWLKKKKKWPLACRHTSVFPPTVVLTCWLLWVGEVRVLDGRTDGLPEETSGSSSRRSEEDRTFPEPAVKKRFIYKSELSARCRRLAGRAGRHCQRWQVGCSQALIYLFFIILFCALKWTWILLQSLSQNPVGIVFLFLLFLLTKDLQNFSEIWRHTVVKCVMKLARVIFKGNFREHLKSS